jgi:selenium metabolism protein YedF
MADMVLDLRGLSCPLPVVRTKEALESMEDGDLTIIVDNESSRINVGRFLESQGFIAHVEWRDGDFYLRISKGKEKRGCEIDIKSEKVVVYIGSNSMGRGDDDLGKILMASYLDTLSHFAKYIDKIIFVNTGVKLAVEGSPVLDSLRNLQNMGIRILCCGTCLNYFGLKERLKVGEITNMYSIIEAISAAHKVMIP